MAEAAEKQLMKEKELEVVAQANDGEVDNDGEGVDRISNLPEPLAHHIMSFLPSINVARTSTLSKRFYSIWSSFPEMAFDEKYWLSRSGKLRVHPDVSKNKFLDFVIGSIQLRQLQTDLAKFSLKCNLAKINSDYRIDRAINLALENNVKDLNLNFLGYDIDKREPVLYHLKETFSLKSVTFLELRGLRLDLCWLFSTCPFIKSLTLCNCFISEDIINPCEDDIGAGRSLRLLSFMNINITENWVENYVPKFSVLEILKISWCNGLKNIRVSNDHVKEITMNNNSMLDTIKIEAPELHSFQHSRLHTKPCTIDIMACKLLKNLSLKAVHITDEWVTAHVSLFSHLEILSLENCEELVRIEIVNEDLRKLELLGCKNLVEVMVDTPNLLSFKYEGDVVLFGLMNSPRLRNPTLKLISYGRHSTVAWFYGLRDFLGMFDHCKVLTLHSRSYKDFIFPEDVRDITFPPLYDIKTLQINICFPSNIHIELVDNLLWISPLVETLRFVSKPVDQTIKFRYEMIETEELGTLCCKHLPIKCWRHHLRKIEMDNFKEIDDIDEVLEYFKKECQFAGNTSVEIELLQTWADLRK